MILSMVITVLCVSVRLALRLEPATNITDGQGRFVPENLQDLQLQRLDNRNQDAAHSPPLRSQRRLTDLKEMKQLDN